MLAVRVPPSACSTSQSTTTWRSPSAAMSHAARRLRPMRRWISTVRPLCLPLAASRSTRSGDEPGSIEYSAVTHPLPSPAHPARHVLVDRLAVHSTRVRPNDTRHEPAAISVKSRSNEIGRSSSGARPSGRGMAGSSVAVRRRAAAQGAVWFELGPEQAGAELAERVDVAARQEAVLRPAAVAGPQQAELDRACGGRRTPSRRPS